MSVPASPLGFLAAREVVTRGRVAIFGEADSDVALNRSPEVASDDQVPQFGFIGDRYQETRVLLLGINPGNGKRDRRSAGDARMIPVLAAFQRNPTNEAFKAAMIAYQNECRGWPVWTRHCAEVIGAGKLSFDEIAYSNVLPWRTQSGSKFTDEVARRTAGLYVTPLVSDLAPRVIVALGKRAAEVIALAETGDVPVIVWNRAQAATAAVKADRAETARLILSMVNR